MFCSDLGRRLISAVGAQQSELGMTHPIENMRYEESVRFDADRLEDLCREHGDDAAEKIIAHVLEQIAINIELLKAQYRIDDYEHMDQTCSNLTLMAGQIGMTTMASVARDVRTCLKCGNYTGMAATLQRLLRIGGNSVHTIWSLEDISG